MLKTHAYKIKMGRSILITFQVDKRWELLTHLGGHSAWIHFPALTI